MNTQEFVEDFIKSVRSKLIKFFFGIIATYSAAMLIVYFVFVKFINLENDNNILFILYVVMLAVFYLSVFINLKLGFRSFKNLKKQTDINTRYNKLLKEYRKTNNKEAFDQALSELEAEIKK